MVLEEVLMLEEVLVLEEATVLEEASVVQHPVAAVATGAGLPRVSPTAVSPARTCPLCPQSSPVNAPLCAPSAHPPGLDSGHPLSVAMTPDAPVLRSAVLTPVCSITPANCPPLTMDNQTS